MTEKEIQAALAPLEPLLTDPSISEIMVDAPDRVVVERKGKLAEAGIQFDSAEAVRAAIDAALALGEVAFSPGQTVADARLSDGSRILAVLPPTAVGSPYLVIRKFYTRGMTWDMLFEYRAISRQAYELLQDAVHARLNILVAGGAGSGKTTLTNLLAESIPPDERVIVVADRSELPVSHPRRIHLEAHRQVNLSPDDLLATAAKMRPDRLVIGEMYGPELMRALQLMNTGYDGSLFTVHATSPEDALSRLEATCLMANVGLGLAEIRGLIASALQLIVLLQRLAEGGRKVVQITELRGLDHDRYILQPLMRYNVDADQFEKIGANPKWARA